MEPNQYPQDGSIPQDGSAQVDPNSGSGPVDQAQPVDQSQPTVDQSQPAAPSGGETFNYSGATGTDTGSTIATTLDTPKFLGVPVDALMVGGPIFLAGILWFAYWQGRASHTEQLTRLDKQRKRHEAKEAAKPESIDIFRVEREDFLGQRLARAGLEARYSEMKSKWIVAIISTTALIAIVGFLAPDARDLAPLSIIIGPALGSFGFIQYINWLAHQRQQKLTAQLPQVLESMVSTLKAGSPVVECFKLLSETSPEPIRSEFRRALVSMQLGKPFREVLAEMGTRIRTADFKLLTQAIFISQDVGANLADVVATIAEAIRERFRLRDFLAALTAQGKMTALFIGALPYFITAMTYMITPGYITPFLNHPIARIVFIGMMIWEAIGAYILVRMTTFEV